MGTDLCRRSQHGSAQAERRDISSLALGWSGPPTRTPCRHSPTQRRVTFSVVDLELAVLATVTRSALPVVRSSISWLVGGHRHHVAGQQSAQVLARVGCRRKERRTHNKLSHLHMPGWLVVVVVVVLMDGG
ncbi:hypothetical protein LX32DRAFT_256390 [Colletotrichum zoysiae]|uniref:Uncharacterized protein n=1 Tax=Colletotrichum zoysiae TaxID=1216348 RepID=A0AAD9HML3_9PEZI|nr:hypothetical protein LX32DRAFT_256390 [Colletotrichum zoysiae]